MPPTQDDITRTTVANAEPAKDDAERKQQESDEAAAFEGGFQEARGGDKPAGDGKPAVDGEPTKATTESQASDPDAAAKAKAESDKLAKDEAERKAKEEAEAKRWDGVAPAVREFIESQTQAVAGITQRLKSVEGRAGAALSGVEAMKGAMDAANAASKAGREAPSKEAIAAATASTDKWKRLKEDFPDWADAMEEQFAAITATIGKGGSAVDVEKVRQDVTKDVEQRIAVGTQSAVQTARALGRLDAEFGEWEQTVNSKEFFAWSYAGGPTAGEQAAYFETKRTDPGKADAMFKGFAQQYPQWWGEKGARMSSANPADAGALLRNYGTHVKAQTAKAEAERQKKERLEHASPATRGGGAPSRTVETEESAFEAGFKSVRSP